MSINETSLLQSLNQKSKRILVSRKSLIWLLRDEKTMKREFDTNEYVKNTTKTKSHYHTFINRNNLAAGVLRLEPGEEDTQMPHESDEIYYIVRGDGFLNIAGKDYTISEAKAYFVGKNIGHKFHGNTKELVVLYFFGGPDS